ncbi:hypothetical protein QBC39DRAFT_279594, partial [Podospora conica]
MGLEETFITPPLTPENPTLEPPIWSNFRGGICETLPYFKAYKGGLYTHDVLAKGFLIDRQKEVRDHLGAQVIIASLGGGRVSDGKGGRVRISDADEGIIYRAVKSAQDSNKPVGLILGEDYPNHPVPKKYRHPYAVLDFFRITHLWKENVVTGEKLVKVWKVRFEKIDLDTTSWWAPSSPSETTERNAQPPTQQCSTCKKDSEEIFTTGWRCLTHTCSKYFIVPKELAVSMELAAPVELAAPAFLNHCTRVQCTIPDEWKQLPTQFSTADSQHGTEKEAHGGFQCHVCGCCSRRIYWNKLRCENPSCQVEVSANMKVIPDTALETEFSNFDKAHPSVNGDLLACKINSHFPMASHTFTAGNYKVTQYFLPTPNGGTAGSFTLIRSNDDVNRAMNGPDYLFRQLESTDIGLKRNPAAIPGNKMEGLTRHYQKNFGAKYKFGVQVASEGFDGAPAPILFCLHRLEWAKTEVIRQARAYATINQREYRDINDEVGTFNELLALGFMEDDSINFHDDGESDLGPAVAALSLGSPSTMAFRPKYGRGAVGQFESYGLPNSTAKNKKYSTVLEVPFRHGDMMVMHGKDIQKYYEHAVTPKGMKRFSMTSRTIELTKLQPEDRDDAVVKGAMPTDCSMYLYNGE